MSADLQTRANSTAPLKHCTELPPCNTEREQDAASCMIQLIEYQPISDFDGISIPCGSITLVVLFFPPVSFRFVQLTDHEKFGNYTVPLRRVCACIFPKKAFFEGRHNTPAQNFKNQFEENFPVEKLRAMLDKTPGNSVSILFIKTEIMKNITVFNLVFILGLSGSGQSGQPTSGPGALGDYIFTIPSGWTPKEYPDGIVISSPPSNTNEICNITLWPFRITSGDLRVDASNLFREVFKVFALKTGSTRNSVIRGMSPQGWEYFMIKNAVQVPGGNYQMLFGFVFVAKLGNKVAALSGISKDPLVSSCFGLNLRDVWPPFFYSLKFKNWNSPLAAGQMMKKMAGTWMMATATAGDRWVFAPNGRYASAAAAQRYAFTSTEALTITDAYFGDGSYSLDGYHIFLTGDNDKSNPKKGWYRLEQESFDNGNTWTDNLYLLRTSNVDGKDFEVCYHRQK